MSRPPERLRAGVRQIRGALGKPDVSARNRPTPPGEGHPGEPSPVLDLERRLAHLEQLVQGLQDSVHRENQRHDRRLTELETRMDPAALASALSKDARERGL